MVPDSLACRLYLLTVLVETAIDLAIEADLLIRFHELDKNESSNKDIVERKMPVYLTIFVFAQYVISLCQTDIPLMLRAAFSSLLWR